MITANIECLDGKALTFDELRSGDIVLGIRDLDTQIQTREGVQGKRILTGSNHKYKQDFITIPKERRALLAEYLIGNNPQ